MSKIVDETLEFIDNHKEKIFFGIVVVVGLFKLNRKLDLMEKDLTTLEKIYQRSFPLVKMPKVRK